MPAVLIECELFFPFSSSLKQKRYFLRSFKDKLRVKFNVSIAEIDYFDYWQKTKIGIAIVSSDYRKLQNNIQKVLTFIRNYALKDGIEFLRYDLRYY